MDLGLIHGVWSLLILIFFIGIVAFVWNRKRRDYYDKASRIPFEQDPFNQDTDKQDGRKQADRNE